MKVISALHFNVHLTISQGEVITSLYYLSRKRAYNHRMQENNSHLEIYAKTIYVYVRIHYNII